MTRTMLFVGGRVAPMVLVYEREGTSGLRDGRGR